MVKRRDNPRLRRALILALFLLIPALLYDLSALSRTGHKHAGGDTPAATEAALFAGITPQGLLPLEPGVLHPGRGHRHWHTAAGAGGDQDGDYAPDELLRDLVYTHDSESWDGNTPLSDGFGIGGGGGHGAGGGGGGGGGGFGSPFGAPGGNDPGTDFLPFSRDTPPGPDTAKNGPGDPPLLSTTIPSIAAVPEPATWALFILGFGLIGARLRHARDAACVPALTRTRNNRLG